MTHEEIRRDYATYLWQPECGCVVHFAVRKGEDPPTFTPFAHTVDDPHPFPEGIRAPPFTARCDAHRDVALADTFTACQRWCIERQQR